MPCLPRSGCGHDPQNVLPVLSTATCHCLQHRAKAYHPPHVVGGGACDRPPNCCLGCQRVMISVKVAARLPSAVGQDQGLEAIGHASCTKLENGPPKSSRRTPYLVSFPGKKV